MTTKPYFDECPKCGSDYGYYVQVTFSGRGSEFFNFDHTQGDNSGLHDGVDYKLQRTMYCAICQKK